MAVVEWGWFEVARTVTLVAHHLAVKGLGDGDCGRDARRAGRLGERRGDGECAGAQASGEEGGGELHLASLAEAKACGNSIEGIRLL